jgi:hypothetical protein
MLLVSINLIDVERIFAPTVGILENFGNKYSNKYRHHSTNIEPGIYSLWTFGFFGNLDKSWFAWAPPKIWSNTSGYDA